MAFVRIMGNAYLQRELHNFLNNKLEIALTTRSYIITKSHHTQFVLKGLHFIAKISFSMEKMNEIFTSFLSVICYIHMCVEALQACIILQ